MFGKIGNGKCKGWNTRHNQQRHLILRSMKGRGGGVGSSDVEKEMERKGKGERKGK